MELYAHEFSENPTTISIPRSRQSLDHSHTTDFNEGDLVPLAVYEVLPGDTFTMDTGALVRMTTPIHPVMDNAVFDVFYFFVPNRLVWNHWREFCGENNLSPWTPSTTYTVPQLTFKVTTGTGIYGPSRSSLAARIYGVNQYLVGNSLSVSDLPLRAYYLIWNEFFRDENLQSPIGFPKDDSDRNYLAPVSGLQYGGDCLKVNKLHDYFTSCLPAPQKGNPVTIPMTGNAPVNTVPTTHSNPYLSSSFLGSIKFDVTNPASTDNILTPFVEADGSGHGTMRAHTASDSTPAWSDMVPTNLEADLSSVTSATINALRQAFAVQRLFERDARGGTRYIEMLKSHFGVTSPDARLQRPEYLGGSRHPVSMDTVVQQSYSTSQPLGSLAGYSDTRFSENSFTKSFVEHGIVMALGCVRVKHSYCQGVDAFFLRKNRFDFYYPALANIGEQAVLKKEIYANGSSTDDQVFGYQEAWASYRFKNNRLSGSFMPYVSNGINTKSAFAAAWTYSDFYSSTPNLGSTWIQEPSTNVADTLAVINQSQFFGNFFFKCTATRPMPLYSIPGLIDHG